MLDLPCGQCANCRTNRQQSWTARLLVESRQHACASFATLTLNENHVETGLDYEKVQRFWKRLRKNSPEKIRFFCCGEYGSKTNRPHFHAVIFSNTWPNSELLQRTWSMGFTDIQPVRSPKSAFRYIAKYVMKDRAPMWSSRRPGIGSDGLFSLGAAVARAFPDEERYPSAVRIGGSSYPMDQHMRRLFSRGFASVSGRMPQIGPSRTLHSIAIEHSLALRGVLKPELVTWRKEDVPDVGHLCSHPAPTLPA